MKYFILLFILLLGVNSEAQSYRGLAVLNDHTAFVSGSKGTVVKTGDGGKTWDTISPKGYENKDFRDIHAYSARFILVMSSGDSGVVLYTENGGQTWTEALSKTDSGTFFDAMDFQGNFGVLIGDPIFDESGKGYFDLFMSNDSGKTWDFKNSWAWKTEWKAHKGEAFFAASGSNVLLSTNKINRRIGFNFADLEYQFASGGKQSWLYKKGMRMKLEFDTCETCGVYGMAMGNYRDIVLVGGNYLQPDSSSKTAMYFDLNKGFYELSETMPGGYRSGVAFSAKENIWICTGTNGSDISSDSGKNWKKIKIPGYNVCSFSNNFLWVAGNNGAIYRYPVSMFLDR